MEVHHPLLDALGGVFLLQVEQVGQLGTVELLGPGVVLPGLQRTALGLYYREL